MRHRRPGAQRDVLRRRRDLSPIAPRLRPDRCVSSPDLAAPNPVSVDVSESNREVHVPPHLAHRYDYDGWDVPNATTEGVARGAPEAAQVGRSSRRPRPEGIWRRRLCRRPRHRRRGVVPVGQRAGHQTLDDERGVAQVRAAGAEQPRASKGLVGGGAGAVAAVKGGELAVRGCVVEFSSTGPGAGRGGAIVNYRGDVRISRSTFRGNVAAKRSTGARRAGRTAESSAWATTCTTTAGPTTTRGRCGSTTTRRSTVRHAVNQASSDQSI